MTKWNPDYLVKYKVVRTIDNRIELIGTCQEVADFFGIKINSVYAQILRQQKNPNASRQYLIEEASDTDVVGALNS